MLWVAARAPGMVLAIELFGLKVPPRLLSTSAIACVFKGGCTSLTDGFGWSDTCTEALMSTGYMVRYSIVLCLCEN